MPDFQNNENSRMIYDLRQIYAMIVGEHLKKVAITRDDKDYIKWYEALENLYIEVDQEFSKKERGEYLKLKFEVVKILNENRNAYLKESKEPISVAKVEQALRELNLFIRRVMKKNNMFGSTEQDSMI